MIKVVEYGKERSVNVDNGYIYKELIFCDGEILEFLLIIKDSDYSFYYFNDSDKEKKGEFIIENDSIFIDSFSILTDNCNPFVVEDDYSSRKISFCKRDDGSIKIEVCLLPSEFDGSIELKNIMHDLRSKSDCLGMNTKEVLSNFFEKLISIKEKSLVKKIV